MQAVKTGRSLQVSNQYEFKAGQWSFSVCFLQITLLYLLSQGDSQGTSFYSSVIYDLARERIA